MWKPYSGYGRPFLFLFLLSGPALGEEPSLVFRGHEAAVRAVAIRSDGQRVVTGDRNGTLIIWDLLQKHRRSTFRCADGLGGIRRISFSPDGRRLAVAWLWMGLTIYSVEGKTVRATGAEVDRCYRANRLPSYNPHGVLSNVRVLDPASGKSLAQPLRDGPVVEALSFAPDGRSVVAVDMDGVLQRFRGEKTELRHSLPLVPIDQQRPPEVLHEGVVPRRGSSREATKVRSASFSSDGRSFITFDDLKNVRIWEALTGGERVELLLPSEFMSAVTLSPDGRRAALVGYDHSITVVDLVVARKSRSLRTSFSGKPGTPGFVEVVAFAPRSTRAAVALPDNTIVVLDCEEGKTARVLKGHTGLIRAMAFSPAGDFLVSGGEDRTVRVWELE